MITELEINANVSFTRKVNEKKNVSPILNPLLGEVLADKVMSSQVEKMVIDDRVKLKGL